MLEFNIVFIKIAYLSKFVLTGKKKSVMCSRVTGVDVYVLAEDDDQHIQI